MQLIIIFSLGLLWMFLTGIQTQLFVKNNSDWFLALWVIGTSLIWGYLIKTVIVEANFVIPYAIGTGIGAFLSRKVNKFITR